MDVQAELTEWDKLLLQRQRLENMVNEIAGWRFLIEAENIILRREIERLKSEIEQLRASIIFV